MVSYFIDGNYVPYHKSISKKHAASGSQKTMKSPVADSAGTTYFREVPMNQGEGMQEYFLGIAILFHPDYNRRLWSFTKSADLSK